MKQYVPGPGEKVRKNKLVSNSLVSYIFLSPYHKHFIGNAYLLVGGYDGKVPEVVDFENPTTLVPEFEELPFPRVKSAGGLISGIMILCGGKNPLTKSCITYKDQQWTETHTMTTRVGIISKLAPLRASQELFLKDNIKI